MSKRIEEKFRQTGSENRAAFIAYLAAGDPTLEATRDFVLALERVGVDIVEIGLPFSDPLADGVVNQAAAQRALNAGATVHGVLDMISSIRQHSQIPIVLYTYLNPVFMYGYGKFHQAAAASGIDGLLILDLPPDEAARNAELADEAGLCHIRLVAPTTPERRVAAIVQSGSGFVYYVSREGVTGERAEIADTVADGVAMIKRHTSLPVAVGFGISKPEHVCQVAKHADGVVVGSAIVRQIEAVGSQAGAADAVAEFVRPLASAVRSER